MTQGRCFFAMLLDSWQKPSVATILLEALTPLSSKERGRGVITAEGARAIRSRNMGRKTSGAEEMSCPLHLVLGMQVASVGAQLAIVHTQPASPHLQLASEKCNMAEGKSPWPTFGLPARQEALSRLLLLNGHLPAASDVDAGLSWFAVELHAVERVPCIVGGHVGFHIANAIEDVIEVANKGDVGISELLLVFGEVSGKDVHLRGLYLEGVEVSNSVFAPCQPLGVGMAIDILRTVASGKGTKSDTY